MSAGGSLSKEVALSEPMAKQEVDRYTFRAPGQATSYYYGYQRQLALHGKLSVRRRCRGAPSRPPGCAAGRAR